MEVSIYGSGFVRLLNPASAGDNPSDSVDFRFNLNSWERACTLEIETTVANWLPMADEVSFNFCGTFIFEKDTYRLILPEMIKTATHFSVNDPFNSKVDIVFHGAYKGKSMDKQVIFIRLPDPKTIACDGCINYHGKTYGDSKLVCAMHPAGVDDDRCGDWEGKSETTL